MNDPFSNLNFGKSIGRIFFSKTYFRENFAKISQNQGKFLIFGKCMGPILVNVWVSFHFPSGRSIPKKPNMYVCMTLWWQLWDHRNYMPSHIEL